MIERVRISNLGVIEHAELELGTGLTALTGETGAGKTMAVTSLQLLLGAKADPGKVRQGADLAEVEGTFVVPADAAILTRVAEVGGQWDDDGDVAVLIVARHVPASGRSRSFIGGRSVPTAVLREIAGDLVTVHGQSDQLRLATAAQQRRALDLFGGQTVAKAAQAWADAWNQHAAAQKALADFEADIRDQAQQRLAYEALVQKVDAVRPQPGEDEELRAQARYLETIEQNYAGISEAAAQLAGSDTVEEPALTSVAMARRALDDVAADDRLNELRLRLSSAENELNDIAATLADLAAHTEADPEKLAAIYERRQELSGLRRELGMGIDEALEATARARAALERLGDPEATRDQLVRELEEAEERRRRCGADLHSARAEAARGLEQLVQAELTDLALPDARFEITVEAHEPAPHGADAVSFLLASHRGAPLRTIGEGASGGELSRVMLAVEVALATREHETDHTFLFDEVDAGIGGRAALAVGRRLANLGNTSQVIVVTHLAQVAAYAQTQAVVVKRDGAEAAHTDVRSVEGEERLNELARMLGGTASETARAHAAELLEGVDVAR